MAQGQPDLRMGDLAIFSRSSAQLTNRQNPRNAGQFIAAQPCSGVPC